LDEWNERRRQVAQRYLAAWQGVPGLILPFVPAFTEPAWHLFVVRHPQRDALQKHLREAGIGTLIHYPIPPHLSEAYQELDIQPGTFPLAEEFAATLLSLPIGPHLTEPEQSAVIECVCKFL
jgi:dTDP-4-amino-4,6-dideoxygalactose transaminase